LLGVHLVVSVAAVKTSADKSTHER